MGSKHAVVVSYLALFIALGGSAVALEGKHSVHADDLAGHSVTARALAKRSVRANALANRSVKQRALANHSVGPATIRTDAVTGRAIGDGGVGNREIAVNAVDSLRIQDGSIKGSDLGNLERVSLNPGRAIYSVTGGIRIASERLDWAGSETDAPAFQLQAEPGGGGGLILDGSAGPKSGYLQFEEAAGTPTGPSNTASLFARDDGAGHTQLVVVFSNGVTQVLATSP